MATQTSVISRSLHVVHCVLAIVINFESLPHIFQNYNPFNSCILSIVGNCNYSKISNNFYA